MSGWPRASWTNRLDSSPLAVGGVQNSATLVTPLASAQFGHNSDGSQLVGAAALIYNPGTPAYLRSLSVAGAAGTNGSQFPAIGLMLNGNSYTSIESNAAVRLAQTIQANAGMVANPGEWAAVNTPAANTQATITKAAGGAGVRHVFRGFAISFIDPGGISAGGILVHLRDGASGAGTILRSWIVNSMAPFDEAGHNILGSANTAMTLEFAAAGGAASVESVSMNGYSTS